MFPTDNQENSIGVKSIWKLILATEADEKIRLTTATPKPPPTIKPTLINPTTYECKIFDDFQKYTKPTDMIISTNRSDEFLNRPFRIISKYDSTQMEKTLGRFWNPYQYIFEGVSSDPIVNLKPDRVPRSLWKFSTEGAVNFKNLIY